MELREMVALALHTAVAVAVADLLLRERT